MAVLGAAAAVVGLSYLPHVAAVGTDVVGFLPKYLSVEGYAQGHRFLLLGLLGLTGTAAKVAAGAVLAGRLEWAAVAVGPYVLYMALFRDLAVEDVYARPGGYVLGAAAVALTAAVRRIRA
ncbi:hypothetical protein AB1484_05165 [Parafrankia sp. FMc6]|uniref:hypothetical protein n=1 Tax=Parafrankia soli TaxID=2599596 RepID=UPI0034D57416